MTGVPDDLLSTLNDTIAATVKTWLPQLATCKGMAGRLDVDALARDGIKAPAVLISRLGARQMRGTSGPQPAFALDMAAFVVTKDALGLQRDAAAANICQLLLMRIPNRVWGLEDLGEAREVEEQSLISSASQGKAVSLWVVTWVQPVSFVAAPAPSEISPTLYVGQAPAIGTDHVADYDQIGGQS